MGIFHKLANQRELKMVEEFKQLLDADANFVRPLSDFWKGCTKEQVPGIFGTYGLWLSGEGGSMIDGEYAAYYYDKELSKGHAKIQDFIIGNNLELTWFDCGTPMLIAKTPKCNF